MIDSNNPDPSAIALPTGGYLAVATSNLATDGATEPAFPIYFSPDLVAWQLQAEWRPLIGPDHSKYKALIGYYASSLMS